MLKLGIIGAGQAGQRIAVALSTFEDVSVVGIVDPMNGREILTDPGSPWSIPGVKFFDSDDEMLAEEYDAIVLAADPISVSHAPLGANRKMMMLARNKVSCPILWERPLGYKSTHPKKVFDTVPSDSQSIISFARYGLPTKAARELISKNSLGELIDFEFYLTLNCGLLGKRWRHNGKNGVTLVTHFLDNAFEQIESMGLGKVASILASRTDTTKGGVSYDEKWELTITLDNGLTGRVIGVQYVGESEFLYGLRSLRLIGTCGALYSAHGRTCFIDSTGKEHLITLASYGVDPRTVAATNLLERFFCDVDGYPSNARCRGEAQALAECLRTWVDSLGPVIQSTAVNLTTQSDATRYLGLAEAAITSAGSGKAVSTSKLY